MERTLPPPSVPRRRVLRETVRQQATTRACVGRKVRAYAPSARQTSARCLYRMVAACRRRYGARVRRQAQASPAMARAALCAAHGSTYTMIYYDEDMDPLAVRASAARRTARRCARTRRARRSAAAQNRAAGVRKRQNASRLITKPSAARAGNAAARAWYSAAAAFSRARRAPAVAARHARSQTMRAARRARIQPAAAGARARWFVT